MAKKKEDKEEKEEKKESFDLKNALETVNPYMLDGFKRFLVGKDVTSQKQFNKLLKEYGGV